MVSRSVTAFRLEIFDGFAHAGFELGDVGVKVGLAPRGFGMSDL